MDHCQSQPSERNQHELGRAFGEHAYREQAAAVLHAAFIHDAPALRFQKRRRLADAVHAARGAGEVGPAVVAGGALGDDQAAARREHARDFAERTGWIDPKLEAVHRKRAIKHRIAEREVSRFSAHNGGAAFKAGAVHSMRGEVCRGGGLIDTGDEAFTTYPLQRSADAHARAAAEFDDAIAKTRREEIERGLVLAAAGHRHGSERSAP